MLLLKTTYIVYRSGTVNLACVGWLAIANIVVKPLERTIHTQIQRLKFVAAVWWESKKYDAILLGTFKDFDRDMAAMIVH